MGVIEGLIAADVSIYAQFIIQHTLCDIRTMQYEYIAENLQKFLAKSITFDNSDDVAMHDKMLKLVKRMLDLHKRLATTRVPRLNRR